jgi:hypothetical protein
MTLVNKRVQLILSSESAAVAGDIVADANPFTSGGRGAAAGAVWHAIAIAMYSQFHRI